MIPGRDTTRRRRADSWRLLGRLERLEVHGPLWLHTVPLWRGSVWDADDIGAAKLAAASVLAAVGAPGWVRLERGRGGGLHLHIVTPARWLGVLPGGHRVKVWSLPRLAAYLSKPHDARQARRQPVDVSRYGGEELDRQALAAQQEEARHRAARRKRRCPARAWTFQPSPDWRPPGASSWRLRSLVAVSLALLALAVSGKASMAPRGRLQSGRRVAARRRPGVRLRRAGLRWGRWSACVG